jgi:GR25 family glycosyltransferase involved in LPS biosynthesis
MRPTAIVYINLDQRTDRNEEIQAELTKKGLEFIRFPAISNTMGSIGCNESHLAVLKEARAKGWESVLILEDDFSFTCNQQAMESGFAAIDELGPWHVILFAYNSLMTKPHNQRFVRIMEAQTTAGYMVHNSFYDRLIEVWEEGLTNLKKTHINHLYAVDQSWKRLQPVNLFYGFSPVMGRQRESWSDIEKKLVNYGC